MLAPSNVLLWVGLYLDTSGSIPPTFQRTSISGLGRMQKSPGSLYLVFCHFKCYYCLTMVCLQAYSRDWLVLSLSISLPKWLNEGDGLLRWRPTYILRYPSNSLRSVISMFASSVSFL